ncbi:peptidase C39 [Weizmannia acidilactici]|uniref:C39 family peptidase n=1 Tax=Weizmannia acidilactici TaxID=2607726 RepID=UPI001283B092|nr:peptidase C39 [Weizmannia acidilactici]
MEKRMFALLGIGYMLIAFLPGYGTKEKSYPEEKTEYRNVEKLKTGDSSGPGEQEEKKILDVPLIWQNPELKYGCEVTSLAMVLRYAGIKADKTALAKQIKKDSDPLKKTKSGDIVSWGDPEDGFVGDVSGKKPGYAVYDREIAALLDRYMPHRAYNLTGAPFEKVLQQVEDGRPVVVWTTGDYRLPDRWEKWQHKDEVVKTPLDLHAVVLVGYDAGHVYIINDPLSGKKPHKVIKSNLPLHGMHWEKGRSPICREKFHIFD